MDLMLAAEQMVAAQAQAAAAAAAAAYYQSAVATTAAATSAAPGAPVFAPMGMNHPRAPPLAHGAPGGFGLLPAPMNLGMGGMGQPPPPPPMQQALNQQAFGDHAVASGNDYDQRIIEHDDRDRRDYRRDDRERRDRGRDRERDRDRDRDSSSRRGERERDRRRSRSRSRSRDRGRDRSRDRSSRRRSSRDRDRSPRRDRRDRSLSRSSDDEERGMGPEFHNSTIMVRGLAQHIMENDIRGDITDCGLRAKDIRLIRKKESGNVQRDRRIQRGEPPDSARDRFCSTHILTNLVKIAFQRKHTRSGVRSR